jgi:hypothetical protein
LVPQEDFRLKALRDERTSGPDQYKLLVLLIEVAVIAKTLRRKAATLPARFRAGSVAVRNPALRPFPQNAKSHC